MAEAKDKPEAAVGSLAPASPAASTSSPADAGTPLPAREVDGVEVPEGSSFPEGPGESERRVIITHPDGRLYSVPRSVFKAKERVADPHDNGVLKSYAESGFTIRSWENGEPMEKDGDPIAGAPTTAANPEVAFLAPPATS